MEDFISINKDSKKNSSSSCLENIFVVMLLQINKHRVILLMVQKSQGQPPVGYIKPCKTWDKLPTSTGFLAGFLFTINRISGLSSNLTRSNLKNQFLSSPKWKHGTVQGAELGPKRCKRHFCFTTLKATKSPQLDGYVVVSSDESIYNSCKYPWFEAAETARHEKDKILMYIEFQPKPSQGTSTNISHLGSKRKIIDSKCDLGGNMLPL